MVNVEGNSVQSGPDRFIGKMRRVARRIHRRMQVPKNITLHQFTIRCWADGAKKFVKAVEMLYFGMEIIVTSLQYSWIENKIIGKLITEVNASGRTKAPCLKRAKIRLSELTPLIILVVGRWL